MPLLGMVMGDLTKMAIIVKEILVHSLERMVPIVVDIPVHNKEPSYVDYSYLIKVPFGIIMGIPVLPNSVPKVVFIVIETIVDISDFIGIHMDLLLDIEDLGTVLEMPRKLLGNGVAQIEAKDGEPMPFEKHEVVHPCKVVYFIVLEVPLQNQPI